MAMKNIPKPMGDPNPGRLLNSLPDWLACVPCRGKIGEHLRPRPPPSQRARGPLLASPTGRAKTIQFGWLKAKKEEAWRVAKPLIL